MSTGRPLTPENLTFGLARAADPQISPGGDRVLYTLDQPGSHRHGLWICGVDGSDARPFSDGAPRASGGRWSPDGAQAAFTASEGAQSLLAVVDSDGANMREIAAHAQRIGELEWSPDGRRLAYTTLFDPENPDELPEPQGAAPKVRVTRRLDYKEDGRGYLGDRRLHVYVVAVSPAAASRRVTSALLDHDAPEWSPDGRWLGMRQRLADRQGDRLLLVDPDSGESEEIEVGGSVVHWTWAPDGERILFAADPDHTQQPDYFVHDRATGSTERATTGLRSSPDPARPLWLDERRALVHAFDAGASALETVDIETGAVEQVERSLSRNAGLSCDRSGRYVVQSHSTLETVGELRVFDRETVTARTITSLNTAVLGERPPALWEKLDVPSDEFTIDAWLLKPPDFDPGRRYPVVLDVHGGPSANYGYGFLAHEQCFATNGFLVVFANPRGSTSYGRHFAQQVVRDWGHGDYRDLLAVLDSVLERPYADAERTGIFGISYGGYMTAWAIGQSDRFAAAVCGSPIFDLESDWGTSDVAFNGLEHHGGGPPHAEPEWYASHSPSTFAHRTRTPTLIFHGEADHRCPIGQSEQMFVALRKAGCEVEFVRYPEASHMFFAQGLPEHRHDFLARTLGWFKQHLGEPQ
ncbi:MAG: prolyl oligopeptidase family serine peptidase [Gaiellaceae bacterium]